MSVKLKIAEELAVTVELCGASLSEAAMPVMVEALSRYPLPAVLEALSLVQREHEGRLTLAAIIKRISDGRPAEEEAWAMAPKSERDSAVLTDEMNTALIACGPLLSDGDEIAARMAFREAYRDAVARARAHGVPVRWSISLGWDKAGRVAPMARAVALNRIPLAHALSHVHGEQARELRSLSESIPPPLAVVGVALTAVTSTR